jgi:hypothetical protein
MFHMKIKFISQNNIETSSLKTVYRMYQIFLNKISINYEKNFT